MKAAGLKAQQDWSVLLCPGTDTLSPGSRPGAGLHQGQPGMEQPGISGDIVLQEQEACSFL